MSATYPERPRRVVLPPAILASLVLLVGAAIIETDIFTVIRYVVSILALICVVLVVQAHSGWWAIGLVPIAILWNPVFPIDVTDVQFFSGLHYLAALVFIIVGVFVRAADPPSQS